MKKRWRLFRSREQEPPVAQQPEATSAADAAHGRMSHEEIVCEKCGRPYARAHEKELGKRALKMDAEEMAEVPKRQFKTAEELVRDFSAKYPEVAAQIRKKFSPEWEAETWKRIDKDWNLRTVDDLP